MRARTILVIIILLVSIFFITSCGKKAECKVNTDCATGNSCVQAKCTDGTCVKRVLDACCGNGKCETGENSCTCDEDCGQCEGIYKYNITNAFGKQTVVITRYISLFCENDRCIKGVLPDKINTIKLVNDISESGAFKAELLTTINNPFIISNGKVSIRLLLKDRNPLLVDNITFTRIQVLDGSEVLGEKIITQQLAKIGDIWTEELTLVSAQSSFEDSKNIDVKLDYEYAVLERTGTNSTTREPIYTPAHKISSMKNRLAEKITVIKIPE